MPYFHLQVIPLTRNKQQDPQITFTLKKKDKYNLVIKGMVHSGVPNAANSVQA